MSFISSNVTRISYAAARNPTTYSYVTIDTLINVQSRGYFDNNVFPFKLGDIITVCASDATATLVINDTAVTGELVGPIPGVQYVRQESDFPDLDISGFHPLESKEYVIIGDAFFDNPLKPPTDGRVTFRGINNSSGTLCYTGADEMFKSADIGTTEMFFNECGLSCPNGELFDLDSSTTGRLSMNLTSIRDVSGLGIVKNLCVDAVTVDISDFGQGLVLEDNNGVSLLGLHYHDGKNEVSTHLTIRGTQMNIELNTSNLDAIGSNETLLNIDPDTTVTHGSLEGVVFSPASGGVTFAPDSLQQDAFRWNYVSCKGVPNSTVKALLRYKDSTLETDMSGGGRVRINAIWSDGDIEERMVFRDKVIFDNATNALSVVDGEIDAAGGTPYEHNFTDGDQIRIILGLGVLPTGVNDGVPDIFVKVLTSTTFEIYTDGPLLTQITFSDDGTGINYLDHNTGDSASCWFCYVGDDPANLAVSGWVAVEKAIAGVAAVRTNIMRTDTAFNVIFHADGSTLSAQNNIESSSTINDIVPLLPGEGILIYMENKTGIVNNISRDARISIVLT